jgi:hypothetical protein
MTDATKATPLSADIQPKIGAYISPGVQTPPPAIPQDQVTGKTTGVIPRARAKSRLSKDEGSDRADKAHSKVGNAVMFGRTVRSSPLIEQLWIFCMGLMVIWT